MTRANAERNGGIRSPVNTSALSRGVPDPCRVFDADHESLHGAEPDHVTVIEHTHGNEGRVHFTGFFEIKSPQDPFGKWYIQQAKADLAKCFAFYVKEDAQYLQEGRYYVKVYNANDGIEKDLGWLTESQYFKYILCWCTWYHFRYRCPDMQGKYVTSFEEYLEAVKDSTQFCEQLDAGMRARILSAW